MITPAANTDMMNLHLAELSTQVAPGARAVLVRDGACWHQRGTALQVPANITRPPYSPELNPMEKAWDCLRQNKLCPLIWDSCDEIVDACAAACNGRVADPERVKTIGTRTWAVC